MSSKLPIQFDYRNTMAFVAGEHGLRPEDFSLAAAKDALEAFRLRVDQGEIGFPNLPDDHAAARAVAQIGRAHV